MPPISIPTSAALPPTQRLPTSSSSVSKILQRLSRPSLLSLALDWLDDRNQELSAPYLHGEEHDEDDADLYPPAQSLEELREFYAELQKQKGSRKELVDRIIEGDWRHGVSLYQLAMADLQYLYDHRSSQKWTAFKILRTAGFADITAKDVNVSSMPRFHPPTFLENLQNEILPDVKAHYHLDSPPHLSLTILRIFLVDSPYNTALALANHRKASNSEATRTVYVAFPNGSPHIFISLQAANTPVGSTQNTDTRNLRALLQDAIPKALSRPRERYQLQPTTLSARTLEALLAQRGSARGNAAGGGWSTYAEVKAINKHNHKDTPLNQQLPTPPTSDPEDERSLAKPDRSKSLKRKHEPLDEPAAKQLKGLAQARFANSAKPGDKAGIERLDIRISDAFPRSTGFSGEQATGQYNDLVAPAAGAGDSDPKGKRRGRRSAIEAELEASRAALTPDANQQEEVQGWMPDVRITFHGTHVFAGIRELVECGIVDGARMPGWMTGEEGVSLGVVREGRIVGFKGSGI